MATATIIDQTDPPLLKRARRYEREALRQLFERSVAHVYAISFALTGDPGLAEQHTTRVFARVVDRIEAFDGNAREFDAWVYRMAINEMPGDNRSGNVLRRAYRALEPSVREALTLRVLVGMETGRVAHAAHRSDQDLLALLVRGLRSVAGATPRLASVDLKPFDLAIDRLLRGASPETAASGLVAPEDAHLLLATAAQCLTLAGEPIPAAAQGRIRTALLADVGERRALWVQRHRKPAAVPGIIVRRGSSRWSSGAVLLFMVALAVALGAMVAIMSMFADPDSPFYATKRIAENALLAAQFDPTNKANLDLELAQTRDREAEDMAIAGRGGLAATAVNDRYALLRDAALNLSKASRRDSRWQSERSTYEQDAALSTDTIQAELTQANQARAAAQVKQLTNQFQSQRKSFEAGLGFRSSPKTAPTPAPTPS